MTGRVSSGFSGKPKKRTGKEWEKYKRTKKAKKSPAVIGGSTKRFFEESREALSRGGVKEQWKISKRRPKIVTTKTLKKK